MKAGAHGGRETPPEEAQTRATSRQRAEAEALREAFARVVRRYKEQRAASPPLSLAGHLCEQCLDAPAVHLHPAPWGGEMGVCASCRDPEGRADGHG
jgi:hypothetical protein